jgi:hypothetical protein
VRARLAARKRPGEGGTRWRRFTSIISRWTSAMRSST